ncbi:hypothetical protein ABK040_009844 [Willaertia magna]
MKILLLLVTLLIVVTFYTFTSEQLESANILLNLSDKSKPFKHVWKKSVGSCHATFCLRADWRKQLKIAQEELGFTGIRFHGILDDDMSVVLQNRHNASKIEYAFYNIDNCYDFLVGELKMKPIVELSFMPELLASDPSATQFHYKGGISPPKNINQWTDLIYNFIKHLVDRYGLQEVSTWDFEVWNEPNLRYVFWTGTQQDYFEFYTATANVIKRNFPSLRVGGPATAQSAWLDDFIKYMNKNQVPFDFISTHEYPTDIVPFKRDTLITVAKNSRQIVGQNTPLYYTEWNGGLDNGGHGTYWYQDSSYPAALVTHTLFEVYNYVDVYSYWTFTDLFEEQGQYPEEFHEAFGMMTINSIRKPVWRAFELLGRSGDEMFTTITQSCSVSSNNCTVNAYATLNRNRKELMIFISNYQVPTERQNEFNVKLTVAGGVRLSNCKQFIIDETHSNAFTKWKEMNSPTYPTNAQLHELHDASQLKAVFINPNSNNEFTLQVNNPSLNVLICNV